MIIQKPNKTMQEDMDNMDNLGIPLVSFIVPIYNVRLYVRRCVESIMNQDYPNIEIILIDDGSQDGSEEIIDELAKADCRIRVVHKQNGGVSSARNEGLKLAQGEYVLFIDGDDYIEPDYAAYMMGLAIKRSSDVVVVKNHFDYKHSNQVKQDHLEQVDAVRVMTDIYLGKIFMAVWNKAYRLKFLIENNITFNPEIWYGEGMLFNMVCLQHTKKVTLGEKRVYHYVYNPESAMRKFRIENEYCGIKSLILQKQVWHEKNRVLERAWEYHYQGCYFSILKGLIQDNMIEENQEIYAECRRECHQHFLLPLFLNISLKQKILGLAKTIIPVQCARMLTWREQMRYPVGHSDEK